MDSSEQFDLLITGGTVVTMDTARRVIKAGAIALLGNTIAHVYAPGEMPADIRAHRTIDATGKVVIPGLINAHSHIAMTLFRGLVEDLVLQQWLEKIWAYEFSVLDRDNVCAGAQLAFVEMIRGGVTCVHDMYWHHGAIMDLAEETGFRMISGPPITALGDPDVDELIATAHSTLDRIAGYRYVHPIVQAQSTYTTTPEMMHEIHAIKGEYGVPFTTHASENQGEIEIVRDRYGKTPIELLASYDLLDSGTVLAHCVKLDDREIEMLSTSGTSVAHCPESNLKLGSGIARIADMIEAGVNVCIGTDGTASNNDLDLWGEVRTAALLQKGVAENPQVLTTLQALEMATINGAQAYGLDRDLGSLEPGKRADIAIVDFDKSHLTPCYDVYAHLVYAVDKADVDTVLIDGRIHMENSEIITVDEDAIKARVRAIGKEIV